jgi:hypothetical protein
LPLDILLTIAEFVAGANNYGTLLNVSLVSKVIHEEVKPVLYETMWDVEGGRLVLDAPTRPLDCDKIPGESFSKILVVPRLMDP